MARFTFPLQPRPRPPFLSTMTANDRPTLPVPPEPCDLRPTVVAPPPAALLVDCCRPDLRLPSDALAQAALAVVRDAVEAELKQTEPNFGLACDVPAAFRIPDWAQPDPVEAEVDAMFAEQCAFHANGGEGRCAYCER